MGTKFFTQTQIDYFKRQAKKESKKLGIPRAKALDNIAHRENFKNWSQLMAQATVSPASSEPRVLPMPQELIQFENYKQVLSQFIKNLSDKETHSMLRNACSIWIDAYDALNNNISVTSLTVLGQVHDGITTQYASKIDAVLALNFAGLGDMFKFQDGDDENVSPGVDFGEAIYSPKAGRAALLSCVPDEGAYESFCISLDEYSQDQNQ